MYFYIEIAYIIFGEMEREFFPSRKEKIFYHTERCRLKIFKRLTIVLFINCVRGHSVFPAGESLEERAVPTYVQGAQR